MEFARTKNNLWIKNVYLLYWRDSREKFSGWLLKKFEDVAQLHGGIANYGKIQKHVGTLGRQNVSLMTR